MDDKNEAVAPDNDAEIDRYMKGPCEIWRLFLFNFGKKEKANFPKISRIAEIVLSIPASSAAVERLFSVAGKIYSPARCRLSDSRFEQLMFIKCN
jgi:hypothetical protein